MGGGEEEVSSVPQASDFQKLSGSTGNYPDITPSINSLVTDIKLPIVSVITGNNYTEFIDI